MSDAPFHAHVYFAPEQRPAALALRERFAGMPQVLMAGALRDAPVGPHTMAQFEIHFEEGALPVLLPILEASGLRVLVHPLTDDDLADHTTLGRWIGPPLALDVSVLDPPGQNQGIPRFGKADF